jgi:dimethylhistidine N-methyltransferase
MSSETPRLHDLEPATETFEREVIEGLSGPSKTLPCKYFYDERGSELFEQICSLEEYYPTRTERGIMEIHQGEMARCLGPECMVIEPGSGTGEKARRLLHHMDRPSAFVPIEISREFLVRSAEELDARFDGVEVLPVCADFHEEFDPPTPRKAVKRRVMFFPGSTLGNFEPDVAEDFLRRYVRICGSGGALLVGIDLRKDRRILKRAYDDSEGVTAEFNKNILRRINHELGGDFDLDRFQHKVVYNEEMHRVEMHLESLDQQQVRIGRETFIFRRGETICTEHSHKYSFESFRELMGRVGAEPVREWTDERRFFGIVYSQIPKE